MHKGLDFNLEWLDSKTPSLVRLAVSMDDRVIWPAALEAAHTEVFADDLWSFLVVNWEWLLSEPFPILTPVRPSLFRETVEARWQTDDSIDTERESILVEAYEQRHNLASCFAGIYELPPLWIVGTPKGALIDNGEDLWELEAAQLQRDLKKLADTICNRLAYERSFGALVRAWKDKLQVL